MVEMISITIASDLFKTLFSYVAVLVACLLVNRLMRVSEA